MNIMGTTARLCLFAIVLVFANSADGQQVSNRAELIDSSVNSKKTSSTLTPAALEGQPLSFNQHKGGSYSVTYKPVENSVGLQFDLHVPNIALSEISCGDGYNSAFVVDCTVHKDADFVRVIVFSLSNKELVSGDLISIQRNSRRSALRASADQSVDLALSNVKIANRSAQDITPAALKE